MVGVNLILCGTLEVHTSQQLSNDDTRRRQRGLLPRPDVMLPCINNLTITQVRPAGHGSMQTGNVPKRGIDKVIGYSEESL